jgi:choline-sulfatase
MTAPANLIFIQSDNHNRQITGCYGHAIVRTPTLDKLAESGVRFADSYSTSALCCPARAAMATGRYAYQTGYWDNAIAYDARVPSWMRRLREEGHTVVGIGKFHYRSSDDDNGFSEEIIPMHLHEGRGAIKNLLRGYGAEPALTDDSKWKLYTQRSGAGSTHYQDYDRQITAKAIAWLRANVAPHAKPWALKIGYISPHPPFTVPQRLLDLYPENDMPLPVRYRPGDRPEHPSARHLREIDGYRDMTDERVLRRIAAAYFGLITHLDEQIGAVMKVVEELGLLPNTRIVYTSDHGELFGWQGMFGKKSLYEGSVGVPLIFAGAGMPRRRVVRQLASHVDLFPTVVEGAGGALAAEDCDLPGISLFPAINGCESRRLAFAEYHAQGSKAGQFMLRDGALKLIYHVGMPAQLFDLAADPIEAHDLVEEGCDAGRARTLEARLREICDPEEVDARAKADQRKMAEFWGGPDKLRGAEQIIFTPPPGVSSADAWAIPKS